jgi:AmmeMemoRadiSam system protein B
MNNYRSPSAAGLFYPSRESQLKDEVNTLLNLTAETKSIGKLFGIIAPHAGYIYSGRTAAYSYNLLRGQKIDTVIIISPSHSEYFKGSCIYEGDGYITPLGTVDIDKELSEKIISSCRTVFSGINGHRKEHAVEVHLPFLQVLISPLKIVPVVMGDQDRIYVEDLAQGIAACVEDNSVILVSSDLSHFYHRDQADKLDSLVQKYVSELDYEHLLQSLAAGKCEACGGGPIAALMKAADLKDVHKSKILHRSNSGDISGDFNEVVGYLSAVVYS